MKRVLISKLKRISYLSLILSWGSTEFSSFSNDSGPAHPRIVMVSLSHSGILFTQASNSSCSLIRNLLLHSERRFESFMMCALPRLTLLFGMASQKLFTKNNVRRASAEWLSTIIVFFDMQAMAGCWELVLASIAETWCIWRNEPTNNKA